MLSDKLAELEKTPPKQQIQLQEEAFELINPEFCAEKGLLSVQKPVHENDMTRAARIVQSSPNLRTDATFRTPVEPTLSSSSELSKEANDETKMRLFLGHIQETSH